MNDATKEILSTYDKDELKEIANHGCESGVCSQHIYYDDTVSFYEKHEADILEYFDEHYDTEFLVGLFEIANACLDNYKNAVTWAFIESIAFTVTDDDEFHGDINYGNRFAEDYSFV